MKIILKKMRICNFMDTHDMEFDFFNQTIATARNGKGKSTLINAYMWLLFDCDADLHSNPAIRRTINGNPVNDTDVSVEGMFSIDGKTVVAKKVQKRTISEKEEIVDGQIVKVSKISDDNTYFINDVPKTFKAFKEYFDVDMKIFQMCSNINVFIGKKDKDMREYIFGKIDNISDYDIAAENENLSELVELLKDHSKEEIEAMNKASLTKIEKEIPVLKGQIMEKERDITSNSGIDVAELELEKNLIQRKIEENLEGQKALSKTAEEYSKLSNEYMMLKFKLSEMEANANAGLIEQRSELMREIDKVNNELRATDNLIAYADGIIKKNESDIKDANDEKKKCADEWFAVKGEVFNESTAICPTCHREFPEEEKKALLEKFEVSKNKRLDKIARAGKKLNGKIDEYNAVIKEFTDGLNEYQKNKTDFLEKKSRLEAELIKLPMTVDISGNEEYKVLVNQISEKEKLISECHRPESNNDRSEYTKLSAELIEIEKQIANADTSKDEERLDELKEAMLTLQQKKTDCQKIKNLLNMLDKVKNNMIIDKINSMFSLVKWKLFDFAKNGTYNNVCIPMVDNKSILTLASNKGNRILGKIDITNTIQKIEELNVPVFLDDIESLDDENLRKAVSLLDCQVICLKVGNNDTILIESL